MIANFRCLFMVPFLVLTITSGKLIGQEITITEAVFWGTPEEIGSCPVDTVIWFEDTLSFKTEIFFDEHQANKEVNVKITHTYFINGEPYTEQHTIDNQTTFDLCTEIIVRREAGNCGYSTSFPPVTIDLYYGQNIIKIAEAWFEGSPIFYDGCEMIIYRPMPQVTDGDYDTIFPEIIAPGTTEPIMIFNPEIKYQVELSVNDTFSYGENIKMQVYLDDMTYGGPFTVPSDSTTQYLIPSSIDDNTIPLPDYEPHHIYYKAFFEGFEGGNDSLIFVSDSLHVQRKKPEFEEFDFVYDSPEIDTTQINTFFDDVISFRVKLCYNDTVNFHDSVNVICTLIPGGFPPVQIQKDSRTLENFTDVTVPSVASGEFFTFLLNPYYNTDIELILEAKFFRGNEVLAEIDNLNNPVIIYHPAPRVTTVEYDSISPIQVNISNMDYTGIFDSVFRFNAKIDYNDPYSHSQDTICMDVFYNQMKIGETHKVATDSSGYSGAGNTTTIIPDVELASIPLKYFEDSVRFIAYFQDFPMEDDSVVASDTLLIERVKPIIEDFDYMNPYPVNLQPGDWKTIFTDSVMFRVKLWYNDSVNFTDSIQVIALREIYSEGQKEKVDTAYNVTIKREPEADSLYILVPPMDEERLVVPLNERYDSILVYFQANFIRDELEADTLFSYNTDSLKIIHPAPAVDEVLYETSILQPSNTNINPGETATVFDTAVQVRFQINYADTCSIGDTIFMQAFYNGESIGESYLDSTRFWGDGNILIPRVEEQLMTIPLEYGNFENDWDIIHFEAYFTKTPDSVVSSDSLFIYREKPKITSHLYVDKDAEFYPDVQVELFNDSIHFRTFLEYNDDLNSGDSVKVEIYRQIDGGEFVVVDEAIGTTLSDQSSITIPDENSKFTVELDPNYNDSISVFFKAWFIRDGQEFEHYSTQDTSMLRIYHPAPRVETVEYDSVSPIQVNTSNMDSTGIFDSVFRFNAKIDYNDPFSHSQDTICMDVFYNQMKIGETHKVATDSSGYSGAGSTTTIIPDVELASIPLKYFEDSVRFIAYFQDFTMEDDSIVKSDTLLIERIKPKIDSIAFLAKYPENLSTESWSIIYTDSIEFRTKLFYNDSINKGDTIRVVAIREIFSGTDVDRIDSVYQKTITFDPENPYIIIPHPDSARINIPLENRYDSILVHFEAHFIRDGLEDPEIYKSILFDSTLKIIHPAPTVNELLYETSILQPSNTNINPGDMATVFDTAVQVQMQIIYADTCSVDDSIFMQAYYNGDPFGEVFLDSTRFWGAGNILIPRNDNPLINIPLGYGDFENDWDIIHFEAYFTKTPDSVVSSDSLFIYREKPVITTHEYIPITPTYLSTDEYKDIFHDTIGFDLNLSYNDDLIEGDTIETKIFRQIVSANPPYTQLIETLLTPKPTGLNSIVLEGIQIDLDPFWDDSIRVYFEARILRYDLPDTEIHNQNGSDALLIIHPRPKVEAVEFDTLKPVELQDTLNYELEIYNKTISFGAQVFYNDTFSDAEMIRVNTIHEYYQNNLIKRDTIKSSILTTPFLPGEEVMITFPDSIFNIDDYDSAYHKFYMNAWFAEEDFAQTGDTIPSDNLILTYRINKKPIVEITTPYDKIYKSDTVEIEGIVTDSTGWIEDQHLWVRINDQDSVHANVSPQQNQSYDQTFNATVFLDEPINNVFAWARDAVPFTNDEELESEKDSIRVNYVFFENTTAFFPVDASVRLIAYPPGGVFQSESLEINQAGVFNPSLQDTIIHTVSYTYTTPGDLSEEEISKNIEILPGGALQGQTSVCENSLKEYSYTGQFIGSELIDWEILGGIANQFDVSANQMEIKWLAGGLTGEVRTSIKNGNAQPYEKSQMVAINNRSAAPRAEVVRKGKVFFCSIDTGAHYQWLKNGDPIPGEDEPYYYCNNLNESDSSSYYSVLVWDCEDCDNARCETESHRIYAYQSVCSGCEGIKTINAGTEFLAGTDTNDQAMVDIKISESAPKILELQIANLTTDLTNIVTMDVSALNINEPFGNFVLRLKGLTKGDSYKVSILN